MKKTYRLSNKKGQCPICKKTFNTTQDVLDHIARDHYTKCRCKK